MATNTKTNSNLIRLNVAVEKTSYGVGVPTSLTGNSKGDVYYSSSTGSSTGYISAMYRWDGTKWIKEPGGSATPLTPSLDSVVDFKTTAQLAALAAAATKPNDQTSYICTDGANMGKIATWDAVTGAWIYYTPTEGEITTMTNPSDANNFGKWKYDAVSKTWVQVVQGLVLPEPAKRVKGGMNIAFPSRHIQSYRYTDTAGIGPVIQNDEILAFGMGNYNYGDLTNNSGFPKKLPFSFSNLNGANAYSPIATYVPKFVDLDACLNNLIALDSTGKPWVWSWSSYWHGLTSTPTATTATATAPTRALYPVAFFQGRPDIIVSRVYSKSVNFDMVTDARSLACLDTLGRLWMTGSNGGGELGQGNTTTLATWGQFGTLSNIVDIKMAQNGTFALTKTGQVYFAGMDSGRWMGGGANVVYNVPTLIPNCTNVKDFDFGNSANATFFMVVKNDGTVWGGGNNGSGQLGIPTSAAGTQIGMAQVPGITNGKRIYCDRGGLCSCLLRTDGSISFAGNNRTGIFGYQGSTAATTPPIYTFVTPSGGMQGTVVDVLITENSTLALTVDGSVWRTGSGVHGGLGSTSGTTWALQNSWKRIPLPEPVLMMRGHTNQSTQDGVQFLTGIRGIIAYGASGTFRTNNVTISSTNSWRVLDDLRTWDTGIIVSDPIAQTI